MEHWLDRIARGLGARTFWQGSTVGPSRLERILTLIAATADSNHITRRAALKLATASAAMLSPVGGAVAQSRTQLAPVVSPCSNDTPTRDSLQAARAALSRGANDVALSPRGCYRYRRTFTGGRLSSDQVVAGSKVVRRATYGSNNSSAQTDFDYDDVPEERTTYRLTSDGAANVEEVLIEQFAPRRGPLVVRQRRPRRSNAPNVVRIVHEEQDKSQPSGPFTRLEWTIGPDFPDQHVWTMNAQPLAIRACTSEEKSQYEQALGQAIEQGIRCLNRHGSTHTAAAMAAFGARGQFECDPDLERLNLIAEAKDAWNPISFSPPTILINPPRFRGLSATDKAKTIFHELMHFTGGAFSVHNPILQEADLERFRIIDTIYACGELCFGSNPTKCHCASCATGTIRAPQCSSYSSCNPDLGAFCLCPCRLRYYRSRTQCAVECPSGLCCFGSKCRNFDFS